MIFCVVRLCASIFLLTLPIASYASYMALDSDQRGEKRKGVEQNAPNKRARYEDEDRKNREKLDTILKQEEYGKATDGQLIWAVQQLENRFRTPTETLCLCNIYRHNPRLFENAYQRAIECCDDVLENHPTPKEKVWALTNKGKIFGRLYEQDLNIAENRLIGHHFLRAACEVEGADRTTAYKLYINALLAHAQISDISQFLEKQTPRDPSPYLYLRWAHLFSLPDLDIYNPKMVIKICRKAISNNVASSKLYNLYAGIYKYELKDNKEAIRILEEGVQELDDNAKLFCPLATLYVNEKRPNEALNVCKEGLEKNSKNAELYYLSANICAGLADSTKDASTQRKMALEALSYFEKADRYGGKKMKNKLCKSRDVIKNMKRLREREACPW